ncbi:9944_t:CDS:2, partial [Acaulospora colombiana]
PSEIQIGIFTFAPSDIGVFDIRAFIATFAYPSPSSIFHHRGKSEYQNRSLNPPRNDQPHPFTDRRSQESYTIFKPHTWGKNTFVLHLLCEGLESDNREAHCTGHEGYKILDPKPLLAKVGPYLSIMATVVASG